MNKKINLWISNIDCNDPDIINDSIQKLGLLMELNTVKHVSGPGVTIYEILEDMRHYKLSKNEYNYITYEVSKRIKPEFYFNVSLFWVLGKGWPPFTINAIVKIFNNYGNSLTDDEIIQGIRSLNNKIIIDDERFLEEIKYLLKNLDLIKILMNVSKGRNYDVTIYISRTVDKWKQAQKACN
ncbi:MAG: hypothetical protein ABF289_00810 [Clostridiales bacterium]